MARKRLFWRLFLSYLAVTIVSLLAITWYSFSALRTSSLEHAASDLSARAHLVAGQIEKGLALGGPHLVDSVCKELGRSAATRITVILPSGQVIADSDEDPAMMDNHAGRPEVADALAGRVGIATRYSHTLYRTLVYRAAPLYDKGKLIAVLRVAIPLDPLGKEILASQEKIAAAVVIIALLMAAVSLYLSRRIVRPIEEIKRGAERFARGELAIRLAAPDSEEMSGLATVMNDMAAALSDRITTIARQRNEQDAILAGMIEGVVAVDTDERIISLNQAAARLTGADPIASKGRSIHEVVRNHDLQRLITDILGNAEPVEREIALTGEKDIHLQVHGAPLRDASGEGIGALIVLHDITRIKKLEHVRREFVANVSHELKTPVTAIKGFVETLLGGALQQPEEAARFLGIIEKQVDRLNAIIEDLLRLSQIERAAEQEEIALEAGNILDVVKGSVQVCQPQAAARNIRLALSGDGTITGRVNGLLLEQAVTNLIDNAVKYSEPGGEVQIAVEVVGGDIVISVKDRGCGIEKEHLPRLFERFYRADKSRSRAQGGTGLGLAIAKHIILAHHGRITVESTPGRGSTFSIILLVSS